MKVFNPLQSQKVSGAWNGLTFYNYGDLTVARQTPIPSQPNTDRQLEVRSNLTILSRVWSTDLNDGQRTAWQNFAKDFVWTDLWGREFVLKGIALFTKFNFPLIDSGRTLQLNPPPSIYPSEIAINNIENADGIVEVIITSATLGEITAQDTFLDVWITVDSNVNTIEPPPSVSATIWGNYKPQGVNPVKSDFRHRWYPTETPGAVPPEVEDIFISFKDFEGNDFTVPTRIALILRRYNKYGRYSTAQRISLVSTVAP